MIIKAVITIAKDGGIPEDAVQNSLYFGTSGFVLTTPEDTAIRLAIEDFYNGVHGAGAVSISNMLSETVDSGAFKTLVDFYDVALGGSSISNGSFTMGAGAAASPFPDEVAACLSFHSDLTGVPEEVPQPPAGPAGDEHLRARRRGRIFVGPLSSAGSSTTASGVRPSLALRQTLAGAGEFLRDSAGLAAALIDWVVWSNVDATSRNVVGGWADDAYDTQRRRGPAATLRLVF